ncbi:hypothetical protein ACLOAV_008453 [Pseudogymnoascus australis]
MSSPTSTVMTNIPAAPCCGPQHPKDHPVTQGVATAALTLPGSAAKGSARERQRIYHPVAESEFAFRMEQVISLYVARLTPSRRNLRTILRPIFQLMRLYLEETSQLHASAVVLPTDGVPTDLGNSLRPMIIDQEFAVNSDDEPFPNVTPPKPVTPKPKSADDHDKPKEQPYLTSPTKAEVVPSRRRVLRNVPRRKLADGSHGNVTETPTPVQNPPAAESKLEQSLHDLSVSKEQPTPRALQILKIVMRSGEEHEALTRGR